MSKIEELGGTEVDSAGQQTRAFKSRATPAGWRNVKDRRLMEWGSVPCKFSSSTVTENEVLHTIPYRGTVLKNTLIRNNSMPSFMASAYPHITSKVSQLGLFPQDINHVCLLHPS